MGFSLQDVISNVAGGLALQVDNSIEVGDWVKFNDVAGKVVEIRWRYTAIETRNWETVLVPNSQVMKSQVLVLGRRTGQPRYGESAAGCTSTSTGGFSPPTSPSAWWRRSGARGWSASRTSPHRTAC